VRTKQGPHSRTIIMNAEQVKKQLANMENFILKEAREKVSELQARADEEFTIEKARIVQAEKQKIKVEFERRKKQIEVKNKIGHSNKLNQSRLRKLKAREDIVLHIKDEAKDRLSLLSQGKEYEKLLTLLIIQGLLKLSEHKVVLRVRPEDERLVERVLPAAIAEFKAKSGITAEVSINKRFPLPSGPTPGSHGLTCAGGILLTAHDDKILCDNTLDQRLGLAFDAKLPEIRRALFKD